jgi:hypothetical protein
MRTCRQLAIHTCQGFPQQMRLSFGQRLIRCSGCSHPKFDPECDGALGIVFDEFTSGRAPYQYAPKFLRIAIAPSLKIMQHITRRLTVSSYIFLNIGLNVNSLVSVVKNGQVLE